MEIKKLYCLQCGKELSGYQKKFCSSSCSAIYNNKRRDPRTEESKEKVSKKLKEYYNNIDSGNIIKKLENKIKKEDRFCLNCNIKLKSNQKKFCSSKCSTLFKKKEHYNYYLNHQDEFCRPNYTPKNFKDNFIQEQGGKCAICGMKPEWNGKSIIFILDHIDGDASNNHRSNLRCICPNCDSQLDTFKSKNKYSTRRNYWKEKIIKTIENKKD